MSRDETVYTLLWRNKWLTSDAQSLGDMIEALSCAVSTLRRMQEAGVVLDVEGGGIDDDYAALVTTDPRVAEEFGFVLEGDVEGDDEDGSS